MSRNQSSYFQIPFWEVPRGYPVDPTYASVNFSLYFILFHAFSKVDAWKFFLLFQKESTYKT